MSIEADVRATLAAHSGLDALVGGRIALNAVPDGSGTPVVVYSVTHDRTLGLDGTLLADQASVAVQCWADNAAQAEAVADAVIDAIAAAPSSAGAVVTDRSGTFEPDMGLDGVVLSVEWWA